MKNLNIILKSVASEQEFEGVLKEMKHVTIFHESKTFLRNALEDRLERDLNQRERQVVECIAWLIQNEFTRIIEEQKIDWDTFDAMWRDLEIEVKRNTK